MRHRRSVALILVAVLVSSGLVRTTASAASYSAVSDFNCDGESDVAVAEPGAHRFHVLYGHDGKLTTTSPADQMYTASNYSDRYANAMVTGDFNHDGCSDLAVGDPGYGSGQVTIFLGGPDGLHSANLVLSDGSSGDDEFGDSMAVGDINGDGRTDLVVGAWGANAIYVYLGTSTGLSPLGYPYADGVNGVPGDGNSNDEFGRSLAVGNFDGDGHADVAIGAPYAADIEGRVYVLHGTSGIVPLTTSGAQTLSQNTPGVPGTAENGDQFGFSLAVGGFHDGTTQDLAIGVPFEDYQGVTHAGVIDVLYSTAGAGLTGSGAEQLDGSEAGDTVDIDFGWLLAVGDFNGDGTDDIAVGNPAGGTGGLVMMFYGNRGGTQILSEGTPGVPGTPEIDDLFGYSLTEVQVTSRGWFDLVVGVPGETTGGPKLAGMMLLIPGSTGGLTGTGSEEWTVGTDGVNGSECLDCWFGYASAGPSSTALD